VPVSSQESGWSCICVIVVSILPLSTILTIESSCFAGDTIIICKYNYYIHVCIVVGDPAIKRGGLGSH